MGHARGGRVQQRVGLGHKPPNRGLELLVAGGDSPAGRREGPRPGGVEGSRPDRIGPGVNQHENDRNVHEAEGDRPDSPGGTHHHATPSREGFSRPAMKTSMIPVRTSPSEPGSGTLATVAADAAAEGR